MNSESIRELDVRPFLERGEEPFPAIMAAVDALGPGQRLDLLAPFEPVPLLGFLEQRGFAVATRQNGTDLWVIGIGRGSPDGATERELDLRDLPPPGPLQRVMEECSRLGRGDSLAVHTRFCPVHLYDHLEERGFESDTEEIAQDHWIVRIWRVVRP